MSMKSKISCTDALIKYVSLEYASHIIVFSRDFNLSFFPNLMCWKIWLYFTRLSTHLFISIHIFIFSIQFHFHMCLQCGMWIGKKNCSWDGGQSTYCCDSWHMTPIGCYMMTSSVAKLFVTIFCHSLICWSLLVQLIFYSGPPTINLLPLWQKLHMYTLRY